MIKATDITIAVTVYNRRDYLKQALESVLNQTVSVKVIVVEDCGPDFGLRKFVEDHFGDRVEYFRNPKRRGLFDNWNACLEVCSTPWLSILHDDDYLAPGFIEAMQRLHEAVPNRAFYFGRTIVVDQGKGRLIEENWASGLVPFRTVELNDFLLQSPLFFPGQLFRKDDALKVGGFRRFSQYAGDWEMWIRLIALRGGAQTLDAVAYHRFHDGVDRGTTLVARAGRRLPLNYVQVKRNIAMARSAGFPIVFDRRAIQRDRPVPVTFLLQYGRNLSERLLKYHSALLLISRSPNWRYRFYKMCVTLFGSMSIRWLSRISQFITKFGFDFSSKD